MSRITLKIYGDNFDFDNKEEIEYDEVDKIKKEDDWSPEDDSDIFNEVQNESHGFREAVVLLGNLIKKVTENKTTRKSEDAWKVVYEAFDTLMNSDTLGEFEKRLLEDWWVLQLDKKSSNYVLPKNIDLIDSYYYEKEQKAKKLTKKRKK